VSRRTLYHVSPSVNRASILAHGLDPRRMGAAPGIAGSERRELDGGVCHDRDEVDWFAEMGLRHLDAVDVWEIDDPGSVLQTSTANYDYLPVPVPPERVRLLETRTAPREPEQPEAMPELAGEMWAVIGTPEEVAAQLEELDVDPAAFASLLQRYPEAAESPAPSEVAADLALVLRDIDRAGALGDRSEALASDLGELAELDAPERQVELATAVQRRYVEHPAVDGTLHPPCGDGHLHAAIAEVRDGAAWWVCPADGRALARIGDYGR